MLNRVTVSSLCAALLLAGCGGGDGQSDPLATYKTQQVAWAPCNADQTKGMEPLTVQALGNDLSCAQFKVPMDYANPTAGDLSIGAMRVAAADPKARAGAIFFNPGGPGGDGYQVGATTARLARLVNPASGGYRGLYDMSRKFDFIGFSPRGVGRSTKLLCTLPAALEEVNWLPHDTSVVNVNRALYNSKLQADACRGVPLTPFINTDATARDMDLLRAAIGESKLNYIGYSYGTSLGAWYASLFPQQTGHMLLDSSVDYDMPLPLQSQSVAQQSLYDNVISLYALTKVDSLALPNTIAGIRSIIVDAPDWSRTFLAGKLYKVQPYRQVLDETVLLMTAAHAITQVSASNPTPEDYQTALLDYVYAPNDPNMNAYAKKNALDSVPDYARWRSGIDANNGVVDAARDSDDDSLSVWVNSAVRCSDGPVSQNPAFWVDRALTVMKEAPIASSEDLDNPCMYWGTPTIAKPALSNAARSASPILMVQSEYDMLTPLAGARTTFAALPSASMIFVDGEYTHGIFPYGTECVDTNIANYFLTGAMPSRNTTCAAKYIAGVSASGSDASAKRALGESFTDPQAAQDALDRLHRLIGMRR